VCDLRIYEQHLEYSGISVPLLYEEIFRKTFLTFLHQRMYDPVVEDIVHLTELPCNMNYDLDYFDQPMAQKSSQHYFCQDLMILCELTDGAICNICQVPRGLCSCRLEFRCQTLVCPVVVILLQMLVLWFLNLSLHSVGARDTVLSGLSQVPKEELLSQRNTDLAMEDSTGAVNIVERNGASISCFS
jgi:hypothetical protein